LILKLNLERGWGAYIFCEFLKERGVVEGGSSLRRRALRVVNGMISGVELGDGFTTREGRGMNFGGRDEGVLKDDVRGEI
jgi:hypothetical protein